MGPSHFLVMFTLSFIQEALRIMRVFNTPSATVLLCFIFDPALGFKTPNLKVLAPQGSPLLQWRVLLPFFWVLCPRKTVPCLSGVQNLCCGTAKSNTPIIYAMCVPLSPANEGSFGGACRVFVHKEALYHLPNVLPEGECSLQCNPGDPYTILCTPGPASSFSPGVLTTPPLSKSLALPKPQTLSSTIICKNPVILSTPYSSVHGPERFSTCVNPSPHFHNSFLFLFLFSP